jgi:hypothetical protein
VDNFLDNLLDSYGKPLKLSPEPNDQKLNDEIKTLKNQ